MLRGWELFGLQILGDTHTVLVHWINLSAKRWTESNAAIQLRDQRFASFWSVFANEALIIHLHLYAIGVLDE